MSDEIHFGKLRVVLKKGDITREDSDVIVNAANSSLMGGGGVDGAIHRAGGPTLLEECRKIRDSQGPCATGYAVITGGGKLKARHVVHAVGPIWHGGAHGEREHLQSAYRTCLQLAEEKRAVSISFPSISTGIYGFPNEIAAPLVLETLRDMAPGLSSIREVRLIVFSEQDLAVYRQALQKFG